MELGARVGFDRMEELEPHFEGVDFPVELALPYRVVDFLPIADRMDEIGGFLKGRGVKVLSVHAPQGNLADEDYARWATPAMSLAELLGARSVTFHPSLSRRAGREAGQAAAIRHIGELQEGARALACIETFGGKRRMFHPEEIAEESLPMVLDTAHLHDDDRILRLIRGYYQGIPTVHLSARGEKEHHLPLDAFCLDVVSLLVDLNWEGSLVLEYLPWHHYRTATDLELLERFLAGERNIRIPPPDDKYRNDPTRWGYEREG